MHHCLELTPDGRLLARQLTETPEGLREKITDFTAQAHHRLGDTIIIQAGTRLSAIFKLLMANEALKEIYTRNWVHDYVARYQAIRSGEAVATGIKHADSQEPVIQALVLSQHQEVRLNKGLLSQIAAASEAPSETHRGFLNVVPDVAGQQVEGDSVENVHTVKASSSYWNLSGRSVPFTQDTELWGVKYKAGNHIDYSVSFSFDRCIELPLIVGAGVLTLVLVGKRRKDRLTVQLPLGTDHAPPSITLHELIEAITHDFSFHGGPQETQAAEDVLRQTIAESDDERHAGNLSYGLPHMFCPDDAFHLREAHAQALQDRARYWDRDLVIVHTGWSVLALPDAPLDHQPLTDPVFASSGNRLGLMRPVYPPNSPKFALVDAFEAFAAQRRRDYEQRDELENDE
jgi:hypothetical protein